MQIKKKLISLIIVNKVLKKKFSQGKDDKLTINVRNIFQNNLTNKELRILHGIITTLKNKEMIDKF